LPKGFGIGPGLKGRSPNRFYWHFRPDINRSWAWAQWPYHLYFQHFQWILRLRSSMELKSNGSQFQRLMGSWTNA